MKILLIGLVSISFALCGQQLPPSSMEVIEKSLSKENSEKVVVSELNNPDFSKVWLKNQYAVLGYIGESYQRIHIQLISVIKDQNTQNEYFVYGKSKVRSNVCDFQGKFTITHVRKFKLHERNAIYEEALKQGDQEVIDRLEKDRGFILAEYLLFENPNQKGSGLFKGVVKSCFYIEKGDLYFDDLDLEYDDRYNNNQFVGIWQSYITKAQKICNWGTFRIPNSGDLDIGAAEFSPNMKYLDEGWDTYYRAYYKMEREARKKEEAKWW